MKLPRIQLKWVLLLLSSCFVIMSKSQQESRDITENQGDCAKDGINPFATRLEIFCSSCAKLGMAFQQLFTFWVQAPTPQLCTTTREHSRHQKLSRGESILAALWPNPQVWSSLHHSMACLPVLSRYNSMCMSHCSHTHKMVFLENSLFGNYTRFYILQNTSY